MEGFRERERVGERDGGRDLEGERKRWGGRDLEGERVRRRPDALWHFVLNLSLCWQYQLAKIPTPPLQSYP